MNTTTVVNTTLSQSPNPPNIHLLLLNHVKFTIKSKGGYHAEKGRSLCYIN